MAGDWLKIEANLPEKPEVWQIAGTLDIDPDVVVAKLFKVWRWFDQHTESGNAVGVTYSLVDSITGVIGFAEAMAFSGWLEQDGRELRLPNFGRHNGKTAKNRALTAKRVAEHKAKSNAAGNEAIVTSALPREEKRREDIKSKSVGALRAPDPPAELADSPTPASESPPAKPGQQRVPVQAIVDGYNAVMTRLPKVRKMTRQRQRAIEQLWRDSPLAGDLELFQQYWEECESDPFLSGVGPYRNGHENWRPDFDYLTKPDVVTKTYERAMDSIERGGSQ